MSRKKSQTPRSRVRSAIRQCWMRSRERAAALKREGYCCEECGRKQSRTKGREVRIEVHHMNGIEWDRILEYIYRHVLVDPAALEVLCSECHAKKETD